MKLFGDEVRRLAGASSTNESTYYPAIRTLLTEILTGHSLPFEVRTGTSEKRHGGGADQRSTTGRVPWSSFPGR
jgi:hypothetical protein